MRKELTVQEIALAARPLSDLDESELEQWMSACLRMWKLARGWSPRRWQWRRRWRRASAVRIERTRARMGIGPALCERCARAAPRVHITYGKGSEERYGHFCASCASLEPVGRLIVTQSHDFQ